MSLRPYFVRALLGSLGLSIAVAGGWLLLMAYRQAETTELAESASEDLRLGSLRHSAGYVVSWDVEREKRCFLVRLRNATAEEKVLRLNTVNLEATVCFFIDGLEREFFDHDYYMMVLTSEWVCPEVRIPAGAAVNWSVPFDQMDAHPVDNKSGTGFDEQDLTFDECLDLANPQIISFRAFRYVPERDEKGTQ